MRYKSFITIFTIVIFGTYSSIFIASPIVLDFGTVFQQSETVQKAISKTGKTNKAVIRDKVG